MKKTPVALGIACLAILASCQKEMKEETFVSEEQPTSADQIFTRQTNEAFVPNELLVKFKKEISSSTRSNALAKINGSVQEQVVTDAMRRNGDDEGIFVIRTSINVMDAIARMKGNAAIEYAEPNWIYTYGATTSDPYYTNGSLWGMYGDGTSPANANGSQAGEAWAGGNTGSNAVYVGIIDEGIQFTHPDLDANIWNNPYDAPGDGVDNDGNGYVDDAHGWDFDGNDNGIYDGGSRGNLDKHGTHVAGTIGAESNGAGVAGVNWSVTMISGKFLGRRGGTTANAIKAVDYFTDLKTRHGLNIIATNNSWGGGGYSQALYDAIQRANNAGILFIAAAGNGGSDGVGDNNDATASYPSNYTNANVIAVASITSSGAKSSFSNYGATTVDLGAPGSGIYSTLPPNTYGSYSGTSMATPHVTGAAALYAASHNGASASTIKNAILSSVVPTGSLAGKCVTGGRLNASGF